MTTTSSAKALPPALDLPLGADHQALAVEDELVLPPHKIGVDDVGPVVGGPGLEHRLPDLPLAGVEGRGRQVHDHLGIAVQGLVVKGPLGVPDVLADIDSDGRVPVADQGIGASRLEVAVLVEDPVVGKILLALDPHKPAAVDDGGRIVDVVGLLHEAHDDQKLRSHVEEGRENLAVLLQKGRLEKEVLRRIARDGKFRKGRNIKGFGHGALKMVADPRGISLEIAHHRIHLEKPDLNTPHGFLLPPLFPCRGCLPGQIPEIADKLRTAPGAGPHGPSHQRPVGTDDIALGKPHAEISGVDLPLSPFKDGVVDAVLSDEGRDVSRSAVHGHAHHRKGLPPEAPRQGNKRRDLVATGIAPGRPEVQENHLAPKRGKGAHLSGEIRSLDLGGTLPGVEEGDPQTVLLMESPGRSRGEQKKEGPQKTRKEPAAHGRPRTSPRRPLPTLARPRPDPPALVHDLPTPSVHGFWPSHRFGPPGRHPPRPSEPTLSKRGGFAAPPKNPLKIRHSGLLPPVPMVFPPF